MVIDSIKSVFSLMMLIGTLSVPVMATTEASEPAEPEYIFERDSGIEFEIDTLVNLGTKPITTHKDEDGTGMGFLNTFDTLNKHKASMVIEEIGKPSKDNYTKVIMIKFDNKNEFKIKSYRAQEIEQRGINNNLQIDIK